MDKITDLVLAAQQAHREYMSWHESESRLLTCISRTRTDEIKQDIKRSHELRRTMIAEGKMQEKEYRQLSQYISSLNGELADIEVVAEELEDGALDRNLKGSQLWSDHLARRAELAHTHLDEQIASDLEEARAALAPLMPMLARLVARGREKAAITEHRAYLQDHTSNVYNPEQLIAPATSRPLDMVNALVAELLEPIWPEADPELDPVVMAEAKRIPPSNLIRLDLVGSPAATVHARKVQAARREQTEDVQASRDNWSPEAMLRRRENARPV